MQALVHLVEQNHRTKHVVVSSDPLLHTIASRSGGALCGCDCRRKDHYFNIDGTWLLCANCDSCSRRVPVNLWDPPVRREPDPVASGRFSKLIEDELFAAEPPLAACP